MSVVVVGAGLAGAVAAARLAARGHAVTVVADRPGATALHGGGWYLGLQQLARFGLPAPRTGEALAFVTEGLPALELMDGPFALTDADGAPRVVDVAPRTHALGADLGDRPLVADLTGLGHPFAAMQPRGEVVPVAWPAEAALFDRSHAAVAATLDTAAGRDALAEALRAALAGREGTGLLLPPVLGVAEHQAAHAAAAEAAGMPVAEALGTLPSAPGLRLHRALADWLTRLGVRQRRGRVDAVDAAACAVRVGDETIEAAAIVLATGGPLPGGLATAGSVREPLAGLRLQPALPTDFMSAVNPTRPYGEALFRTGVAVDVQLRPCGYDGEPVHPRLFAAGDLIGGPDAVADACGSGLALLSGYVAAEQAADALEAR